MATTLEAFYAMLAAVPGVSALIDDGGDQGVRIFPDVAPAGTSQPYIVHQVISAIDAKHLRGRVGLARLRHQVTIWGDTPEQAAGVAALLWDGLPLMRGTFGGVPVRSVELVNHTTGAEDADDGSARHDFYARVDALVWYAR